MLTAVGYRGLSLTPREYYNLKKGQTLNAKDKKSINGLLYSLDDVKFQYRCRVSDEVDKSGKIVSRKLIQIWFTHLKLIEAASRYVIGSVLVINATFNTNKARLPIIITVEVLPNSKTFPIAFLYCKAEDNDLYTFFWQLLKDF